MDQIDHIAEGGFKSFVANEHKTFMEQKSVMSMMNDPKIRTNERKYLVNFIKILLFCH